MKSFIGEIFDPVKEFYKIRNKVEKCILFIVPLCCGILAFVLSVILENSYALDVFEFTGDIINQFITILSLFISFSMCYLSMILTSGSQNVKDLQATYSKKSYKDSRKQEPYNLYEILVTEITYTIVTEIFFLFVSVSEKFLIHIANINWVKIVLCIDIFIFVHIVIMLLVTVKNIYYSFWKSK